MAELKDFDLKYALTVKLNLFNVEYLAKYVSENKLHSELVALVLINEDVLSSRASWVLWHCNDIDSELIIPFYSKLILNMRNKTLHYSTVRNTLRLFQKEKVPKKHEAFMLDLCYGYIKNPHEAIAIRAFSITIIYNICKFYKELFFEFSLVLSQINQPNESAGMKSKIKNTLRDIEKELQK